MADVLELRRRLGLTQPQLAKIVGVTEKTVRRWESGETTIAEVNLYALQEITNIVEQARKVQSQAEQDLTALADKFQQLTGKGATKPLGSLPPAQDRPLTPYEKYAQSRGFRPLTREEHSRTQVAMDTPQKYEDYLENGELALPTPLG